ncbi:MAG: hypothetical protein M1822_002726 [Bathelium mastoideum]|nr:MAG: hypothetical protein M1822_002726 [Bathelium mastoideum]
MPDPSPYSDPKSHPDSEFAQGMTGTCNCGAITSRISGRCHTFHSNLDISMLPKRSSSLVLRTSGSYAASNLAIESSKVTIDDPDSTLRKYIDPNTMSGTPLQRWFCSRPIKSDGGTLGDMVVVKTGLFPRIPAPDSESFGAHRQTWAGWNEGVTVYKIKRGAEKLEGAPEH